MSKRIYAERSAKTLSCLLEERPDVVYYCQPGLPYPDGTLVVDYDLYHLGQADVRSYRCAELSDIGGPCDGLVINLPRYVPTEQILLDIYAASRAVSVSGCLTLIMPAKSGHRRVLAMLQRTFDNVAQLSRRPCVFECSGPRPQPRPAAVRQIEHYDSGADRTLSFLTRPGLFSPNEIDGGTKLLLATADISPGSAVLDVGCGYGAIGVTAAARGAEAEMIDCDSRAVTLAASNLRRNGLAGRARLAASLYGMGSRSFDLILSNPPTHGGNRLLVSLFRDMVRVCSPSGSVLAVVGRHLSLEGLFESLAHVAVVAENATHKVLKATPR